MTVQILYLATITVQILYLQIIDVALLNSLVKIVTFMYLVTRYCRHIVLLNKAFRGTRIGLCGSVQFDLNSRHFAMLIHDHMTLFGFAFRDQPTRLSPSSTSVRLILQAPYR